MTMLTRRRRGPEDDLELSRQTIGNALVVHRTGRMSSEAQALALSVAEDTEHDLVVVDLPADVPISTWESVAEVLPRRRRGIRLVLGGRSREATALAGQWLSERLGRVVVAPDGVVVPGGGGSLFVHSGRGSGWVRFEPGRAPRWEAKRFPRPSWDSANTAEMSPTSSRGVAEPLPGGLWVRPVGFDQQQRTHRHRIIELMPIQPATLTVVLGAPGNTPVSLDDVARLWVRLPETIQSHTRFVQFGPVAVPNGVPTGQALADLLSAQVAFFTGLPVGSPTAPEVRTVRTDGELGWRPFAKELGYHPRGGGSAVAGVPLPQLLSHRPPLPELTEVAPGVYWYSPDAVIEVVQSGLLVRGVADGPSTTALRAVAVDPIVHQLTFDGVNGEITARMRRLAEDLFGRLDQDTRRATRLLPASSLLAERASVRVVGQAQARIETIAPKVVSNTLSSGPTDARMIPPVATPGPVPRAVTEPAQLVVTRAPTAPESMEQPTRRIGITEQLAPESTVTTAQETAQLKVASPIVVPVTELPAPPAVKVKPVPEPVVAEPPQGVKPPQDVEPPRDLAPSLDTAAPTGPRREPASGLGESTQSADEGAPAAELQPVPGAEASALLPKRGIDDERAWLRKNLGQDYGIRSNAIARVLSEHPGFQGAMSRSSAEVLTDAVAVQLYLSSAGVAVDQALRSATVGAHVPLARCVVSGLSRLPSHRGPSVFTTSPTARQWALYRDNPAVTEWAFLNVLTGPCVNLEGDTDVLVWSMTGRRTRLLETGPEAVPDRVLFVPGTSFKVLELIEPSAGARGLILLREVGASEVDDTGTVDPTRVSLDELALTSLRGEVQKWADSPRPQRVGKTATSRFGALPGLV
jgi:hypothetical protein